MKTKLMRETFFEAMKLFATACAICLMLVCLSILLFGCSKPKPCIDVCIDAGYPLAIESDSVCGCSLDGVTNEIEFSK